MDRVWDTSKYRPKISVSKFKVKVIKSHEVKERSNWKFYVWAAWYMFFLVSLSLRTRKMTLEHVLNGPNRTKLGNWQNAESQETAWKNGRFQNTKIPTHDHVSRYPLAMLYTYTTNEALSYIFRSLIQK